VYVHVVRPDIFFCVSKTTDGLFLQTKRIAYVTNMQFFLILDKWIISPFPTSDPIVCSWQLQSL
jgi:hypothetical protein